MFNTNNLALGFYFQVEDHRVVSVPYHSVQVCMHIREKFTSGLKK